jgi:hypothetical protein
MENRPAAQVVPGTHRKGHETRDSGSALLIQLGDSGTVTDDAISTFRDKRHARCFSAVQNYAFDAVDGSSTGTSMP